MNQKYEYDFVRLEGKKKKEYRDIIKGRADKRWRLVQVFAPGAGGLWGSAADYEIIFEREVKA